MLCQLSYTHRIEEGIRLKSDYNRRVLVDRMRWDATERLQFAEMANPETGYLLCTLAASVCEISSGIVETLSLSAASLE